MQQFKAEHGSEDELFEGRSAEDKPAKKKVRRLEPFIWDDIECESPEEGVVAQPERKGSKGTM